MTHFDVIWDDNNSIFDFDLEETFTADKVIITMKATLRLDFLNFDPVISHVISQLTFVLVL